MNETNRKWSCVKCGKLFQQKQSLICHKTSHHGTAKFSCQTCFKEFNRRDSLKYHFVKCTEPKERSCKICGKQFPYHWPLKYQIEQKHGTKKSWVCEKCGRQYQRLNRFKAHTCDSPKLPRFKKNKQKTSSALTDKPSSNHIDKISLSVHSHDNDIEF